MTESEFFAYVVAELGLSVSFPFGEMRLIDDLGLDSLQMLELAVVVEELGAEITEEFLMTFSTLEDVYALYSAGSEPRRSGD